MSVVTPRIRCPGVAAIESSRFSCSIFSKLFATPPVHVRRRSSDPLSLPES
jgi:hypothetical protein